MRCEKEKETEEKQLVMPGPDGRGIEAHDVARGQQRAKKGKKGEKKGSGRESGLRGSCERWTDEGVESN